MNGRKNCQVNTALTELHLVRMDERWKRLDVNSRSAFIQAAIIFFEGQTDETVVYWMGKVQEDMKRERE